MYHYVRELLKNYERLDVHNKIDIDTAIQKLAKQGKLSEFDCAILELVKAEYSISEIAEKYSMERSRISHKLSSIAKRIAAYLGDGYVIENNSVGGLS